MRPSCASKSAANRQAHSHTHRIRVKSGLIYRSMFCEPIPCSGVRDRLPLRAAGLDIGFHAEDPRLILRRHRIDGVCDQVQKHLLQLDSIPANRQPFIRLSSSSSRRGQPNRDAKAPDQPRKIVKMTRGLIGLIGTSARSTTVMLLILLWL